MNALFTSIKTRWTAMMGGLVLYNTEAIEEATFPYGVVGIINDTPDFGFDGDVDEEYFIQFNIFSDSTESTEVTTAFGLLKAAFDKYDLVVAGYTLVSLVRGPANLIYEDDVWQLNVSYVITLEKNTLL